MKGRRSSELGLEYPTVFLGLGIYGGWLLLTYSFVALPLWVTLPLLTLLVTLHSSFQHEAIHGHPTRSELFNDLFAYPPLGMIYPYPLYKASHQAHHLTEHLTHPIEDPESYYVLPSEWKSLSKVSRGILVFHNTVVGRLLIGPALAMYRMASLEIDNIRKGKFLSVMRTWGFHITLCFALFAWLWFVCGITPLLYFFGIAYPGLSIAMIRSFAEHRPHEEGHERQSAIVEAEPIFRLLFLSNNYHFVHHEKPGLPWYAIQQDWEQNKAQILEANGSFRYDGYREVFKRFGITPKDLPVHPSHED